MAKTTKPIAVAQLMDLRERRSSIRYFRCAFLSRDEDILASLWCSM